MAPSLVGVHRAGYRRSGPGGWGLHAVGSLVQLQRRRQGLGEGTEITRAHRLEILSHCRGASQKEH